MCDSTAPNSAATLIALANWFARYVTGSVIGLTIVPRHTCLFVQHAGLTTQPRRILAPFTADPATEAILHPTQTAHGALARHRTRRGCVKL
ncbi:hypothetical protein MRX96_042127 [Rhipicephalus microplus]